MVLICNQSIVQKLCLLNDEAHRQRLRKAPRRCFDSFPNALNEKNTELYHGIFEVCFAQMG